MTQIAEVRDEELSVVATRDGSQIIAKVVGTAEHAAPFASALGAIHAARAGISEVVVDLTKTESMSPACVEALLAWVSDISALPEAERYKVRFIAAANVAWQKRSLHAARCFASDLITITEPRA